MAAVEAAAQARRAVHVEVRGAVSCVSARERSPCVLQNAIVVHREGKRGAHRAAHPASVSAQGAPPSAASGDPSGAAWPSPSADVGRAVAGFATPSVAVASTPDVAPLEPSLVARWVYLTCSGLASRHRHPHCTGPVLLYCWAGGTGRRRWRKMQNVVRPPLGSALLAR